MSYVILTLLGYAACAIAASTINLLANTTLGPVLGHINNAGVRAWNGIRFGKAPVGALRWAYPQSPPVSTQIYRAANYAAGCPQSCTPPARKQLFSNATFGILTLKFRFC